ncbi:MAG: pantetheine-phosphate adenylyltransferase [Haloarculaceae archaeon]
MRVAVAGTFGPIHDGHRALFETALEFGDDGVVVALTSDDMATASRTRRVPPVADRRAAVRAALDASDRWDRDFEFRTLEGPHDVAGTDADLDALVVSPETMDELPPINDERRDRELDPLLGLVVPFVEAEDGERISSTRLVASEVDEHGVLTGEES